MTNVQSGDVPGGIGGWPPEEKDEPILVFRIKSIRKLLRVMPIILLVIASIVLLLSTTHTLPGNVMFSTGILTAALVFIIFNLLIQKIPQEFHTLWRRRIVSLRQSAPGQIPALDNPAIVLDGAEKPLRMFDETPCREFLKETENLMNSRIQWVVAEAFMILPLTWYSFMYPAGVGRNLLKITSLGAEIFIAFLIGLIAWRMVALGLQVLWLPKKFKLDLQPGHPDQCGGLEPLGTLCLWNAYIIALPGIYLGGWMAIGPAIGFQTIATGYRPIFLVLLIVPIIFSLITFITPLWSTHTEMLARRGGILRNLDELAECINQKNQELLVFSHDTKPQEGEVRIKSLEEMQVEKASLQKIYDQSRKIPVWPLNTSIMAKYLGSQAVPFLTLIGVSQKFVDIIAFLIGFLGVGLN